MYLEGDELELQERKKGAITVHFNNCPNMFLRSRSRSGRSATSNSFWHYASFLDAVYGIWKCNIILP